MYSDTQTDCLLGVVGLGEVGLRLALAFDGAGYDAVGVDVDDERVAAVRAGESYVHDVDDAAVEELVDDGFVATTDYAVLSQATHVAVCVPTPLQKSGAPDISYVVDAVERLADVVADGTNVIVESTVYPGATETLLADTLTEAGYTVGEDIYLTFSPERVNPGDDRYSLTEIPKVIGGVTESCADHTQAVYETIFDRVIRVESATEAEMTKILENTFRNVNIALVNELVKVADRLDIDFWNVIDAAETKPYGFMPFYPGPGLGGHCIPVDPMYLSWKARQADIKTPLVDLADETNREMSEYITERIVRLLNQSHVPVPDANVLVLGVAYKANVPDIRNSPALDVIESFEKRGASVSYHDPHIPEVEVPNCGTYSSVPLTDDRVAEQDCVVLITDHDAIDVELVVNSSSRVFDTRNAVPDGDHVQRL
jgi:UDP-N-acetyl-D-glucosamine dehydrogenase